jgi:hypothetical protein
MAVDQKIIDSLVAQILASSDPSKWTGSGYGSAEANAKDMANILANTGITDISQFGQVPVTQKVEVIQQKYNGQNVATYQNEDGTTRQVYFKPTGKLDENGNPTTEQVLLPQGAKVETVYGIPDGNDGYTQVDPSKIKTVNGQLVADTGQTTFGNKLTGQQVPNTYSERQTGNAFGGTFAGKGNTGYRVEFDPSGKPIFYTTGASSSDVPSWVKPALILGAAYFGLNAAGLLGGAGAAGAGAAGAGAAGLTAAEVAALTAGDLAIGAGTYGAGGASLGASLGTGLTAGSAGLGINAAGTAGLGAAGTGAGITAGTGLTGTGVLTGSTLGSGLLSTGAGVAGLTGTGILSGSTLGTNLLGTTGTGALTGTGVLTGSTLGTEVLGTGAGTAATTGGVTGLTNTANVGTGALTTGVTGGTTGVTGGTTGATSGTTGTTGGTGLTGLTSQQIAGLLSGALKTTGGLLQQQTSKEAAEAAQARIDAETEAAKQGAAFRPIGMTTRFGTSNFKFDPVTGKLISAGYELTPEAKAQQDRFMALSEQGLAQAEAAQGQFAPLQTGAQSLFTLGNKYLAQSPEEVAQRYITSQMSLLQPGRELELANLQNKLQQQGRSGLSVAQGGTLGATTPELQALFNARATQEAKLAAEAELAGQQQVTFGAGLLTKGAGAMGDYYSGQTAAYSPYTTAFGKVQGLETLAQKPYDMSTALATQLSTAGAAVGNLGLRGVEASTRISTGTAATTNPYSTVLSGLSDPTSSISQGVADYIKKNWLT